MSESWSITRREFMHKAVLSSAGLGLWSLTTKAASPRIRFGVVTDSHYANRDPLNNRFYRQAPQRMQEFVDVMNREKVNFVVHLGDFKDEDPRKRPQDTLQYLKLLEGIYARFQGPRYHCVGNHDVDSITKEQFLDNIVNSGISGDRSYYSYHSNGFHFVVLDANYHADGRDQFYKEGADWQDPNIPDVQLQWLKNDLKAASGPIVVFIHHPLFAYQREKYRFHVQQSEQVRQILEDSEQVLAVFQGHVHDEHYQFINGIHYYTQHAMVEFDGLDNNSFSIVEVNAKSITINGYKRVATKTYSIK